MPKGIHLTVACNACLVSQLALLTELFLYCFCIADWVDTKDPNVEAETELLHAAAAIEAAAKKLAELKPRVQAVSCQ